MKKIALVRVHDNRGSWGDSSLLATNITEWQEISDEDYKCLDRYLRYDASRYNEDGYTILIEFLPEQDKLVEFMVDAYLKKAKEQAERDRVNREKAEAAKKKRLETKKQKELEKAKAIFEKYNKDNMMMNLNEFDEDDG